MPRASLALFLLLLCSNLLAQENAASPKKNELAKKQQLAEMGDQEAMLWLGFHFRDKLLFPDDAQSLKWFRKAAESQNTSAMLQIGAMYRDGVAVEQDYEKAMELFKQCAELGDPTAASYIGWMHYYGLGVPQDEKVALEKYRESAMAGSPEGMNNLGHMYLQGQGVKKDLSEAIRWFKRSSEKGNSYGFDNLGVIYLEGSGVERDYEKAKRLLAKAGELGLADSMIRLGRLLRAEKSEESQRQAFAWFKRARFNLEGCRELGDCYFDGIGTLVDPEEGLKCYKDAIKAKNPVAPMYLAGRYLEGRALPKDKERAKSILADAMALENADAACFLGNILSDDKEYKKALECYRCGADLGNDIAMLYLGIFYREGWGVKKDEARAIEWVKKAAKLGNPDALLIMKQLGIDLSNP